MRLEEIPDGSYFVTRSSPRNVYHKIGSRHPIPGVIYGITVQELSTGLNNTGFSSSLWESCVCVIPISKEDAYDMYVTKVKDAIKKHEKNLKVLKELLNTLENEV